MDCDNGTWFNIETIHVDRPWMGERQHVNPASAVQPAASSQQLATSSAGTSNAFVVYVTGSGSPRAWLMQTPVDEGFSDDRHHRAT
ncbi:hypothetical protein SAMD00023353_3000360 [Rosellinia necatrix]|uniref:Uncharacterized protein n=1 Tax=Rosellinia necatrix TaxID=77044 RepID=A0A1S8A9K9_ROSNE|nr:hypothetical protein SAMD00023353_3000360 [Rosellinia necatrix]